MATELQRELPAGKEKLIFSYQSAAMLFAALACGFLTGRIGIGSEMRPFGTALILAAFLNVRQSQRKASVFSSLFNPYLVMTGVFAALCTRVEDMTSIGYAFSVTGGAGVLMSLALLFRFPQKRYVALLTALVAYAVSAAIFKRTVMLWGVLVFAEFCACILMMILFDNVIKMAFSRKRTVLSDEEVISTAFVLLIVILGLGELSVRGVSLRNIAAIYLALLAADLGGAALGAGVAVAVGFAAVLSGAEPMFMANIAACALVAGVCKKLGKFGVSVGFVLSNAILTWYINGSQFVILPLIDTLCAVLAFALTPKRALAAVGKYVDANLMRAYEQKMHIGRFRELTVGRLQEIAKVFANAGKIFAREKQEHTISYLLAGIPEQACVGCVFYQSCWDKEFEASYSLMQKLFLKYEKTKSVTMRDLPKAFVTKCIRPERVLDATKSVFQKFLENRLWETKVLESRAVVGDQLAGVSRVIDSLCRDVDVDLEFREDMENEIKSELDRCGVRLREVCAESSGGNIVVHLRVKSCGGEGLCEGKIRAAISRACGLPMSRINLGPCCGRDVCALRYEQARRFALQTGVASLTKKGSESCGDAYSFEKLRDGRNMLLLCDGMGSGKRAARESSSAVSLMEDFYRAGFDEETILNAINKLLILSSSDEIFSTMDVCMVDLLRGIAKFTKIGAPHSYLLRGEKAKKLQAGALPIGILDEFKPGQYTVSLEHGDLIVMFTDGIADLENAEESLFGFIMDAAKMRNVQEIADRILASALAVAGGTAPDDMTVMVARALRTGA